jgi:hypothetical protein
MHPRRRSARILSVLALVFVLAACGGDGDDDESAGPSGGGDSDAADCAVSQEGYELFSESSVSAAPDDGAVFGDGEHQLEFVDDAFDEAGSPTYTYDLSYVDGEDAFPISGGVLEGDGGAVATVDSIFTSEADGKAGIFTLIRTENGEITDDGSLDADVTPLGRFCITIAVDE